MSKFMREIKNKLAPDEVIGKIDTNDNFDSNTNETFSNEDPFSMYNNTEVQLNSNVLDILQIPKKRSFKTNVDIDYVHNAQFTTTAPIGFSEDEVDEFCSKVEEGIREYIHVYNERENDFQKLLEEFIRLENDIIKSKQESELFTAQGNDNDSYLQDKLIAAQIEIQDLLEENKNLKKEIESMKKNNIKDTEDIINITIKEDNVTNNKSGLIGHKRRSERNIETSIELNETDNNEEDDIEIPTSIIPRRTRRIQK